MVKQIAKRLVGHEPVSWETMAGNGLFCFSLMFQISLWNKVESSPLLGGVMGVILVLLGGMWVLLGNHPLFLENRPISATISCGIIIASGCCIMLLGISVIVPLMTEVNWMPRLAGIFYSLAIWAWVFVILKVAPITRALLMGVVFFVIASGYTLICHTRVVINIIVFDIPHIEVFWDQGIAYVLNGAALIAWMLLIVRKTNLITTKPIIVPIFVSLGVVSIGLGIVLTVALVFP